ncbi:AAA family ATPase [Bacillus sp. Marseille-Q1617]|uniref:AAA family ATPase n=1 Tax=Bacillus sp. Marseille-Q1617 TaxID=2736887 RepID=UPI00158E7182|nr:AAA family ATPase [Bacillus sp. Marseille-Q1617]
MIIMINGAFGSGKTTIATELLHNISDSMIFDPEIVGYMIREILPEDIKKKESKSGDFQNYELWRVLTIETARKLKEKYGNHLIVPMTLRVPEYFTYILNGFKEIDEDTHHFCLQASRETIFDRLLNRGEEEGNWCFQQTDKCLYAFEKYDFGEYIDTENVDVHAVVTAIMNKLTSSELNESKS